MKSITTVFYPANGVPVEKATAETLTSLLGLAPPIPSTNPGNGLNIALSSSWKPDMPAPLDADLPWTFSRIAKDGTGILSASEAALLYALPAFLHDYLSKTQTAQLEEGLMLQSAFASNRPVHDNILTQTARTARRFDPESYIQHLARCGFTHLEVNGLAFHLAFEPGVPGEFYSQFYSYGAGLMQFVDTELTRGLYDVSYLQANLQRMKKLAALGRKYGLKPGMMAFEPRTLPEQFFQRYPTLRGARVDHPFRSHMPRYTLAQDHPVSRKHYRELVQNLMHEIPDLAYLSVWTNDSGAGFEHTASLYVGRNGGPYLIREWNNHEKVAKAAGESAVRWLRLIQEAGAEINPDFEVSLRIEPFKVEHDTILEGMGDGVTFEAPSLLVRGYHLPYAHPKLPKNDGIAGTMFHTDMAPEENEKLQYYRQKGVEPKVNYASASSFNMEPLLGTPYPRLLHQKLTSLHQTGIRSVSAFGGLLNMDETPYWPNAEVIRAFQLNPTMSIDDVLHRMAVNWVGEQYAALLVEAWDKTEDGLAHMPYVYLFSNFGFVWYRLWIRPFVPNIEAIPASDRAYYERFMVTMANNSNMNDLGRDVLFELVNEDSGRYMADAFDSQVEVRLNEALAFVDQALQTVNGDARKVFEDLKIRIRAARCWAITQRNLCTWVINVHGYLRTEDEAEKAVFKQGVQAMIDKDIANTRELLELWENSPVEFMLVSDVGETSYIYGETFGEHLQRKIELTEQYRNHDPFIDRDIIWRIE